MLLLHEPATHYTTEYSDGELIVATMDIDKIVDGNDTGLNVCIVETGLDSKECEARVVLLNKRFRTGKDYGAGGSIAFCMHPDKEVTPI